MRPVCSEGGRKEVRKVTGDQFTLDFISHRKDFDFYFEVNEEPLQSNKLKRRFLTQC